MSIQKKISRAKNRELVGTETRVLVEGPSPDTDLLWQARMPGQAPEIDGSILINDVEGGAPQPGQLRPLRITEAHDYDLVGTLLTPSEPGLAISGAPANLIHISGVAGFVIPNQIPAR